MNRVISPLEKEILSGKPVVSFTSGDSMEPLLFHKNTRVVIQKVEGELRKGDLPLYRRDTGQFVMHRIIRVDDAYYYTRGDNRYGLERIPKVWVIGVVTEIYRKKKHILVMDKMYRSYVWVWNTLYPIRYILHIGRMARRKWVKKQR